jgi:hypothetical protein
MALMKAAVFIERGRIVLEDKPGGITVWRRQ